jgi:polar amino acid transport system ATP-binding protein
MSRAEAARPGTPEYTGPVLRLENVHKSFGDAHVLRGIDLEVGEHEVVALIGSSGSGKSTLLRTINLLERVDDGQVWLRDLDISDPRVDADAVRSRIGVVFQHYNLFPHLSVLDNVTLASRHVFGRPKAEADAAGRELLDRIGLGAHAASYPDRLSGGQQQRAAIVRAIATEPELLLLDEITSALDPELVGEVLELVRELKDEGTTIVMATHEMAFARDVADRVVFLDQGVIVEQGPPAQVFGAPVQQRTREFVSRFNAG